MKRSKYYILYTFLLLGLYASILPIGMPIIGNMIYIKQGNGYLLNSIQSIAVDKDGLLYCSSTSPPSIQVYNDEGNVLHAFKIDAGGGVFSMQIFDDKIRVETARGRQQIDYSKEGVLLKQRDIPDGIFADSVRKKASFGDVTYVMESYFMDSGFKIFKQKDGVSSIFVQPPEIYNKVICVKSKFFGILLFVVFGILLDYFKRCRPVFIKQ